MKALLISLFILPLLFIGDAIVDAPQTEEDPRVKVTVEYTFGTRVHVVPLSELQALTQQITSGPDADQATSCSYEFDGLTICATEPYPNCAQAADVFWHCAICDHGFPVPSGMEDPC